MNASSGIAASASTAVSGAIPNFPKQPDWRGCATGMATGVGEQLVWDIAMWGMGLGGPPSGNDLLMAAGISCFMGGGGGSGLPKYDAGKVRIPGPRNAPLGKLDYLLGRAASDDSRAKGRFFRDVLGFTDETLDAALRKHLADNYSHVTTFRPGSYDPATIQFEVRGPITGPNGKTVQVISAWQVTTDGFIDLVTAYPAK
jgi:hypothetical protein